MNLTNQESTELFEQRKNSFKDLKVSFQKKYNSISIFRVLFFIVSIIALVFFANERNFGVVIALVFILPVLFGFFINYHNKIRFQLNQASFLEEINNNEIKRLQLDLKDFERGMEFADPLHPYTSDLNIFGKHSLFQLINRTATSGGKRLLAKTLSNPETKSVIIERQIAVKELSEKLDWRQQFEASGKHESSSSGSLDYLTKWIAEPVKLKNRYFLRLLNVLLPLAFVALLSGYFIYEYSGYYVLLMLVINGIVLGKLSGIVTPEVEKTDKSAIVLKSYGALLKEIEKEDFSAPFLKALKQKVTAKDGLASSKVKRLSVILANLELRKNPYFSSTINLIFLWDLYWILELEGWKRKMRDNIEQWLFAINEFEVINSLAGTAFAQKDMVFPEILESDFEIQGEAINHPLISNKKRVANGIQLSGLGKIHVVTGSNMSGKSTYMRTVGINAVLALVGAPVLATKFAISPIDVFTCMHIHDSLEEETSSFYAELKRIRQLILRLDSSKPILFLLDELLKGTNSVDRNLGAKALIRQLHKKNASGLISTHDLELGEMEGELPGSVRNYSFNSSIIDNEIVFDYTLKDGICHSFNASKLMEKMGIEL